MVLNYIFWIKMKQEFSAGIVVFYKKNNVINYLLLHYERGHWDFAKGHIEKGESKEEAAHRELYEEAGIRATIIPGFEDSFSYIFTSPKTHELVKKTVYFFTGKADSTNVKLSHEHIDYQWLPYEEALKQLTFKSAKDLLTKVNGFLVSLDTFLLTQKHSG